MFSLKIVIVLVELMILFFLYTLWGLGKGLAKSQRFSTEREKLIGAKKGALYIFIFLNVVEIALIEWFVRMSYNPYSTSLILRAFHYSLVGLVTIVFFSILLRFNGIRRPQLHKYFAYAFILLYLGAVITGTPLVYQIPN